MGKKILYVDDNLETGWTRLEEIDCEFVAKGPNDFDTDSDISAALNGINVVLMDYELHGSEDVSSVPIDGIELLERFRAVIRHHQLLGDQVPLLTIYTGKLEKLINDFRCPSAPHLVARHANVDWVFEKGKTQIGTEITRHRLDTISSGFKFKFKNNETEYENHLMSFLKLPPDLPWTSLAKEHLHEARPPIQTMEKAIDHAILMKWLLQVALPVHGCFVDLPWIATRLHLQLGELSEALRDKPTSKFSKLLSKCKYKGALAEFYLEERYWRAGIIHVIWDLTRGLSPVNTKVRKILVEEIEKEIPILAENAPVLLVSPVNFEQTNQVADMDDAVQVQPDFWPEGVDLPWVEISEVEKDRELRAIVINEDRYRLPGNLI